MLSLTFLNPGLLWLLPLLSVPLIIHLLNRRRFARVRWAAMEFLLAALRRNRRRIRMQQWLILLLRLLAVGLLVFVVARPRTSGGILAGARAHHVLCLDDSLSMRQISGAADLFRDGRDVLLRATDDLAERRDGDLVSLFLASDPEHPLFVGQRAGPHLRARVREALARADECGDSVLDVAAVIERAHRIAEEDGEAGRLEATLVTDLRRVDWLTEDGKPRAEVVEQIRTLEPQNAALNVVAVGTRTGENLSVRSLRLAEASAVVGVPVPIEVEVTNWGSASAPPCDLSLEVDGGSAVVKPVPAIEPSASVTVRFAHTFRTPGSHGVVASLPRDRFDADDRRAFAFDVRAQERVLLVDGDPGAAPEEGETLYLRTILNPELQVQTGIGVEVVGEHALGEIDLAPFDSVWLCNVPSPPPSVAAKLEGYAAGGGGVVLFLGNQVDPAAYNDALYRGGAGLLPGPLIAPAGDVDRPARATLADPEHAIVGTAREALAAAVGEALLVGRWIGVDLPPASPAQVVLRLEDGAPLLVAREAGAPGSPTGAGRVVLFTSTADDLWTNMPLWASVYAVVCQGIHRFVARAQDDAGTNLSPRDAWTVRLDVGKYRPDVVVRSLGEAGGERTYSAPPPPGTAAESAVTVPMRELRGFGLFEAELTPHGGGRERRLFARNPPVRESELALIDGASVLRAYPPELADRMRVSDASDAVPGRLPGEGELWRWLALALVAALLGESALGWWIGRRRA
jgi:hypothetical protein